MADEDLEWAARVAAGEDVAWKRVWEEVVEPETRSTRSRELMAKYSLDAGDLMGRLYEEMLGGGKIKLYRGEGSFAGWLRTYVRGYVLRANPNRHGELSIEGAFESEGGAAEAMELPVRDRETVRAEAWRMTHWCFRKLWNEDPVRCYIHVLKTRFFLSSEEIKDFLEISSAANVDQIFSRSVRFMRELAEKF